MIIKNIGTLLILCFVLSAFSETTENYTEDVQVAPHSEPIIIHGELPQKHKTFKEIFDKSLGEEEDQEPFESWIDNTGNRYGCIKSCYGPACCTSSRPGEIPMGGMSSWK